MVFVKTDVKTLTDNTCKLIGDDWMLITAGNKDSFNTMTASWGMMGVLWFLPVAVCFIRPQRHTFQFMEQSELFTMSFFEEKHKNILQFCGNKSGRDVNKIKETGLTPLFTESGNIYFNEARLVLECRKLYAGSLKPEYFIDTTIIGQIYPNKDFHKMFIGEIIQCLQKK